MTVENDKIRVASVFYFVYAAFGPQPEPNEWCQMEMVGPKRFGAERNMAHVCPEFIQPRLGREAKDLDE